MRLRFLIPSLLLISAAGCNGASRRPAPRKTVLARDPALVAGLKRLEEPRSFTHTVRKGDTLYGLSRQYKVPVAAIAAANPGLKARDMKIGSRVVVPGGGAPGGETRPSASGPKPPRSSTPDRGRLRYPVSSKYRAVGGSTPGAEFAVRSGTAVVAAGGGKVVVATADLGGLGPTVMIDHGKGLITMYARLADYAVRPGQRVKRGESLGRVGSMGLLFRVYQGAVPKSPGAYIK